MTDYNDGNWHGWNGGECPVHPESIVDHIWQFAAEGGPQVTFLTGTPAVNVPFSDRNFGVVIAFRVTKPYGGPETYTGECFAYHYTSSPPALASCQVETSIPGKYTATHINGKLSKIVWEASE